MNLSLNAYAKINLGLDVLRRRQDGYHDVKMVMQTVKLHDVITLEEISKGIEIQSGSEHLPSDESNLAYKAARLMIDSYGISSGIKIIIEKNIPIAAGLAGGSTDAAAVIKGMNSLFDLKCSEEELRTLGVKIGADVPYCIMGGTALAEGIGERLTKIKDMPPCSILLAKPPVSVSTKYVYENLHVDTITKHPDIDRLINEINAGNVAKIAGCIENILERVTALQYPDIGRLEALMKEYGALNAIMSGSGPTVFGIFDDKEKSFKAYNALKELNITGELFDSEVLNEHE